MFFGLMLISKIILEILISFGKLTKEKVSYDTSVVKSFLIKIGHPSIRSK